MIVKISKMPGFIKINTNALLNILFSLSVYSLCSLSLTVQATNYLKTFNKKFRMILIQ